MRLALFAAALAALFGAGALAGALADPRGDDAARGPAASALRLERVGDRLDLRILGADGRPIRSFEEQHTKRLHLIVVRRDLSVFRHLHPRMAPDGTWSTPLRLREPGSYRVFADFKTAGHKQVLAADLRAGAPDERRPLPQPWPTADAGDGYEVGMSESGGETVFTVRKDGRPVDDIEPYLGARGHLVAVRDGDLEYLHVHPTSHASVGRDIRFMVEYPREGRYRLFLQFKHRGKVRTAAFTRDAGHHEQEAAHGHGD